MAKLSKRARVNLAIKPRGPQPVEEAFKTLRKFQGANFTESVEVCVHLGIDSRKADQKLRGSIAMPRGIGKSARVVCFCPEDRVEAVKAAGAVEAGGEDLAEKIQGGWMEFDVAVASPDMMKVVGKLGRVLGPKGLMPSPKAGTVTPDVETAVQEYAAGKLEYRSDDGGNVHTILGTTDFSDDDLIANFRHFVDTLHKAKPPSSKGTYLKKCVISRTMSPSVQVAVS